MEDEDEEHDATFRSTQDEPPAGEDINEGGGAGFEVAYGDEE